MTEEQKSSETSASETDWEAPRQNKAVDTSNATSNESHQANTAESVEETAGARSRLMVKTRIPQPRDIPA
ncbi:hypothetical protein [Ellagibacter isourolithinifaciens]|uniref:hypothetical protein n=1 Tax=Ellagibacter isourolithinifaciens TaxID=2137581 RepID=UPI003AAFC16E